MTLAVIGGSGLAVRAPEGEPPETPYGLASSALGHAQFGATPALVLARHGMQHQFPPHRVNYRANIAALKNAGVTRIVATYAVGGITTDLAVADLVVPDQIIDYTHSRAHTFFDEFTGEPVHVDFTQPFDEPLRQSLLKAAERAGQATIARGVYACTQGPRLESAAEVKRLERDGATIVGMTAMPEAALAREAGIAYAGIAVVVNPAAGADGGDHIDESALWQSIADASRRFSEVLSCLDG